jgi:hypothetical protein
VKQHVIIRTHHKTGTKWMAEVFGDIATALNIQYVRLGDLKGAEKRAREIKRTKEPAIFFLAFGQIGEFLSDFRGLNVIRDPRAVIHSGATYHQNSTERWLQVPKPDFDGRTYQQAIRAAADPYMFELEHQASETVRGMVEWHGRPGFRTVKYEDLRRDSDLRSWHETCLYLGFTGAELPACFGAFVSHSLQFAPDKKNRHIQHRAIEPWRDSLPVEVINVAEARFSAELARLDYAPSAASEH